MNDDRLKYVPCCVFAVQCTATTISWIHGWGAIFHVQQALLSDLSAHYLSLIEPKRIRSISLKLTVDNIAAAGGGSISYRTQFALTLG